MRSKRFVLEAATLVVSAAFCAAVANQFASRERKLNLPGAEPRPMERRAVSHEGRASSTAAAAPRAQDLASLHQAQAPPVSSPRPAKQPPKPSAKLKSPRQFPPHPDRPWVEIDPAAVRELYARGVPFIDARRTNVYEQGHIARARSMPVWESDVNDRLKAFYEEELDPEAPLVVYCSGGDCEDSHMLAERLWGIGFNNVLVYKDGFPDWVKTGGPVETGPEKK